LDARALQTPTEVGFIPGHDEANELPVTRSFRKNPQRS